MIENKSRSKQQIDIRMLSSTRNNTENENIGSALRGKSSVTQLNATRGERLKFYGINLVVLIDGKSQDAMFISCNFNFTPCISSMPVACLGLQNRAQRFDNAVHQTVQCLFMQSLALKYLNQTESKISYSCRSTSKQGLQRIDIGKNGLT